jgi:phage protein D
MSTMAQEQPLSERLVYAARPTVRIDGKAHERTSELVLAMSMTEDAGGMSALELRYSDLVSHADGTATRAFADDELLRLGAKLAIYAGDENDPQEIFRGRITGFELEMSQEAPPELVVLAEDALQRARMGRRTAVYQDLSLSDLAAQVAQRAGLRAVVRGYDAKVGAQVQLNESDLAFLRRLLLRYDGDLQVVGDELHVAPRSDVRRQKLSLVMNSQLSRVRVTADLAHQATEVTVSGWDAQQARRIKSTSAGRRPGPGAGRSGAQVLEDALGRRSEHIGHIPVIDEREASAVADAAYDDRARRFVVLEGTTDGNPGLRVGAHVDISGVGARFDNTYYVTRACHRFDLRQGYLTDFEAECAYLAATP